MSFSLALLASLSAQAAETAGPAPSGYRIRPMGGGHSLGASETVVTGPDGGTLVTAVESRVVGRSLQVGVGLPFVAYRTAAGRRTDLGNLAVEGWILAHDGDSLHGVGLQGHVNTGGDAYTWANRAEELWPGSGADLVYQFRSAEDAVVVGLVRTAFGVHSAREFAPYPEVYPRAQLAMGLHFPFPATDRVGVTAEAAGGWWDVSPMELTGLLHVDPVSALRIRAGLILPLLTWAGATPTDAPAGIREATLHFDVQLAL